MLCMKCGADLGEANDAGLCTRCDPDYEPSKSKFSHDEEEIESSTEHSNVEFDSGEFIRRSPSEPARFHFRLAAYIIDAAIISVVSSGVAWAFSSLFLSPLVNTAALSGKNVDTSLVALGGFAILGGLIGFLLIIFSFTFLYKVLFESSSFQSTPGKNLMGLKIQTVNGYDIGFGKAFVRQFIRVISWLLFCAGDFLALFTRKRQAAHDMFTNVIVVHKRPVPDAYPIIGIVGGIIILTIASLTNYTNNIADFSIDGLEKKHIHRLQTNSSYHQNHLLSITQSQKNKLPSYEYQNPNLVRAVFPAEDTSYAQANPQGSTPVTADNIEALIKQENSLVEDAPHFSETLPEEVIELEKSCEDMLLKCPHTTCFLEHAQICYVPKRYEKINKQDITSLKMSLRSAKKRAQKNRRIKKRKKKKKKENTDLFVSGALGNLAVKIDLNKGNLELAKRKYYSKYDNSWKMGVYPEPHPMKAELDHKIDKLAKEVLQLEESKEGAPVVREQREGDSGLSLFERKVLERRKARKSK